MPRYARYGIDLKGGKFPFSAGVFLCVFVSLCCFFIYITMAGFIEYLRSVIIAEFAAMNWEKKENPFRQYFICLCLSERP